MTLSYYYADPDGNDVELQVDCFGDWQAVRRVDADLRGFKANPIGQFVDPSTVAADRHCRVELRPRQAMAGRYAPTGPVEIPEMTS